MYNNNNYNPAHDEKEISVQFFDLHSMARVQIFKTTQVIVDFWVCSKYWMPLLNLSS